MTNYDLKQLDEEFTINNKLIDVYYYNTSQGITLQCYYEKQNHKIHYIDCFDDYYDEHMLLMDLHTKFIKHIKEEVNNGSV